MAITLCASSYAAWMSQLRKSSLTASHVSFFRTTICLTSRSTRIRRVSNHVIEFGVVRDDAKNAKLRAGRGIGFEDMVFHIERGDMLEILQHPNPDRYAGQRIFVVRREDYVYLVPFVEDEETVFLKTIIPSRKATKQYLGEEPDDEDGR